MTSKVTIETLERAIKLTQHDIIGLGDGATSTKTELILPPGSTHITHVYDYRKLEIEEVKNDN